MLIPGEWLLCSDHVVRPVVRGEIEAAQGQWIAVTMLVDIGADCSALSASTLGSLQLDAQPAPVQIGGVGGKVASVVVQTTIRLFQHTGDPVYFRGQFAGFPDPAALDMSVLGRDITDLFAVIVDRPGDRVCLLGQRHGYRIEEK